MKISNLLLTTSILILPMVANAGDAGKKYFSLTGEYIVAAEAEGDVSADGITVPGTVDYKDGLGALAAFGYYLTDDFRTEVEGGYRKLNGDTTSVTIDGTTYTVDSSDTDAKAATIMANLYYNMPTNGNLSPYIGVGAGWAREQEEGANALAYQAMAGLDYKVSGNSTVFAGYRYVGSTDFKRDYNIEGIGLVTEKSSVQAHAIDVGYRYSF